MEDAKKATLGLGPSDVPSLSMQLEQLDKAISEVAESFCGFMGRLDPLFPSETDVKVQDSSIPDIENLSCMVQHGHRMTTKTQQLNSLICNARDAIQI